MTEHTPPPGVTHILWDPKGARDSDRRLAPYEEPDVMGYVPAAAMMSEPDLASTQVSSLLFGESGHVMEEHEGYVRLARSGDGYIGWVSKQALSDYSEPASHTIKCLMTNRYMAAKVSSIAIRPVPMGGRIRVLQQGDRFTQLSDKTFAPRVHLMPLTACTMDPVSTAELFLGVPYVWGGRSLFGIDCSGLVQIAFFMAGVQLHRDSDLIIDSLEKKPDGVKAERGDIAAFKGHVGIMIDPEVMVHSNQTHMATSYDHIDDVIARSRDADSEFYGFYRVPEAAYGRTSQTAS